MLTQSRRRLGPTFTLEIAYEGKWVIVSDPEMVKQVFTGDPKVFHAGEGNEILRPLLGEFSVLIARRRRPHAPAQAAAAALPRRADGRATTSRCARSPGARSKAGRPAPPTQLRPRMQAITLDIILATVFGVDDGERLAPLREALRDFLDMLTDPRFLVPLLRLGPDRIRSFPPLPPPRRPGRRADRRARSPTAAGRPGT